MKLGTIISIVRFFLIAFYQLVKAEITILSKQYYLPKSAKKNKILKK